MDLKQRVGEKTGLYREQISAERIARFRKAVAAASVPNGEECPPTFVTIFRRGEFDLFTALGIELKNVLHAEQEYQYGDPIRSGDEISYETKLAQALEKTGKSGSLYFLTFESEYKNQRGARVALSKTIIVYRTKNVA